MLLRNLFWLVAFAFMLPLVSMAAAASVPGQQAFERGIKAFRAGDHAAALEAFLQARRAGLDTPGLRYNLGVTYYRLKRYPEAEREFRELTREAAWAPVAYYNLGLTAQRLGRLEQAVAYFERAYETSEDAGLRVLAGAALARLGRAPPRRTSVLASLAGGYDSNVALAPDSEVVGLADNSDVFLEASGVIAHRLTGTPAGGFYFHGGLVVREYLDANEFDQLGMRVGLSHDAVAGRWWTELGGYLDAIYVDGKRFEQAATVDLQARYRLEGGRDLRGRYRFSRIDGGGGFGYLDGWQQRLTVEAGIPWARTRMRVGYELELNDREDLVRNGEFYSYSPTRHTLFAMAVWPAADDWRLSARGEYRTSRYNDPNRIDGGTRLLRREEDRYIASLRADRRLGGPWRLFLDYHYTRNDSNFRIYDYSRHQFMAGIEAAL